MVGYYFPRLANIAFLSPFDFCYSLDFPLFGRLHHRGMQRRTESNDFTEVEASGSEGSTVDRMREHQAVTSLGQ